MRFREDSPEDLARARAEVAVWRDQHPAGTGEELVAAIGGRFHRDYGPVLRAVLFAVDRHHAQRHRGRRHRGPAPEVAVSGIRSGLRLGPDELDQVVRLARFKAAHPDVVVGDGGFGTMQARIPEPGGETVITRYTLRELLDKLDELLGQASLMSHSSTSSTVRRPGTSGPDRRVVATRRF